MVKINVLSPAGVDVVTPSERDAGKVDIGVQKDVGVDIKPSIGINIVNNNLITYEGKLKLRKAIVSRNLSTIGREKIFALIIYN